MIVQNIKEMKVELTALVGRWQGQGVGVGGYPPGLWVQLSQRAAWELSTN